jgi:nucleoside-diphosphate-sugar epimerase
MTSALVIGGTRFIGRHTVSELLSEGYDVTIVNRGTRENPFADRDRVTHVQGDRKEDAVLEEAAAVADPDIVIDCVAYQPADVSQATRIFEDVDGYVYISSGDAYRDEVVPKREDETPMEPCTEAEAKDDSLETYGKRKAEGDRVIFEATERGVNAMSVRPCIVYGPHDYRGRLDYWIDRVLTQDRVLVPGDGQNIWHRAYVEDVASALRTVAERGTPGEAYNIGDRRILTLAETLNLIADVAGTDVTLVPAGERELAREGLSGEDFILYRDYPHVLATGKLAALGWESTPVDVAMEWTVADHRDSDRDGAEFDPGRDATARLIEELS